MTTTLIASAKLIEKAIISIANRGSKLDGDIHTAAMSTAAHYAKEGDYTLANRLLMAMPKSSRRQALIAWFCNYTSLVLNADKATKLENPLVHVKGARTFDQDAADATPFWDFSKEAEYRQFDLSAALAALLKKAEASLTNAQQDSALVRPDTLAALRALTVTPEAIIVSDVVVEEQEQA